MFPTHAHKWRKINTKPGQRSHIPYTHLFVCTCGAVCRDFGLFAGYQSKGRPARKVKTPAAKLAEEVETAARAAMPGSMYAGAIAKMLVASFLPRGAEAARMSLYGESIVDAIKATIPAAQRAAAERTATDEVKGDGQRNEVPHSMDGE